MRPSPSQSSSETARQAARREKSLNKIPAMQRVAMEIEQASSSPLSAKSVAEVPGIKKSIEVVDDSDAGVGFAIGALPSLLPLTNGAFQNAVEDTESDIHPDFVAPPSSHPRNSTPPASSDETTPRSEDEDGGISTDVFADFDIQSDSDRAFLREHIREAPKEDVNFLLNTRKAAQVATPVKSKPIPSTPKSQTRSDLPGTPRSLLKYHQRAAIIAEFAQKHAVETIPGVPNTSQLEDYLTEVQTFGIGLGLGPNQALVEAKIAQEKLCKAKGVKLETKLTALEMPGLELTDAIEVLANVQQTVGNLFNASGAPQDVAAAPSTPPTKRKRFRKEANKPKVESDVGGSPSSEDANKLKVESDIGGTPLSETATADSQPEKVILNDRRSKRQKATMAAKAAQAEFVKLNPEAPKLSRRELQAAFIQNKSRRVSANTTPVALFTDIAAAVAAKAKSSEPNAEAPKLTIRERKAAFIQKKAIASANTPAVSPIAVIAAAVAAKAESSQPDSEALKLTRRERKAAFIQNKAKEAAANVSTAAPTTVVAAGIAADAEMSERNAAAKEASANTPAVAPTTIIAASVAPEAQLGELDPSAPKLSRKERKAAFILNKAKAALENTSPAAPTTDVVAVVAPEAGLNEVDPGVPKLSKKERRAAFIQNKAKAALANTPAVAPTTVIAAAVTDAVPAATSAQIPQVAVTAPTGQINAADVLTPATIEAGNEAATDKSSNRRKRKRRAKNNSTPGPTPILPPAIKPPTVAVPNAPEPVVAADNWFIDLRAPKKKKRARKSTTATDAGSNSNASELVKTEAIITPESIAPVEAVNTQHEAEVKPVAKEEANEGDVGLNAAGKRKRKRGPPPPKKVLDTNTQIPTSTPAAVAAPEPMELCVDEPTNKPIAAPILPSTQPLSEIQAPNPASNKRRKRGNRKSIGDENKTEALVAVGSQDPASGGQTLEVAGKTTYISRSESSYPVTGATGVERGLGESKVKKETRIIPLGAYEEAIVDSEDEPIEDEGLETDGEAKVSAFSLSVSSEADSDESREGSALDEFDLRVTRSQSRERSSIDAAQTMTSTKQPAFKYEMARSSTPPLGDSSDEADDLGSPTRPKPTHPRKNSVILPRLAQSPIKSLLQPSEPAITLTPVKKEKAITKSPYFSPAVSPKKRPRSPGGVVSCIPFPPLSSPSFGLLQEKLCHDPLRLLIGVTFLIRTYGKSSIPIYYKLMELFPTATNLANADKSVIVELTRHLGLQSVRADTYIRYAKIFLDDPPVKGKRYRVENYPTKNAHATIKKGEVLSDEDMREGAWEIGHLTKGPYAIDSWRIFCRDELRGLAKGWNGEEAEDEGFQPEWMRVLPKDKELRAFLRWCWLREGWVWDAESGEREVAGKELVDAVNDGRVVWEWKGKDGKGDWRILGKYESGAKEEGVDIKGKDG
ncbi:hypothetical protein VE02_00894 [Pseudogymnoascus sp. 03VT05]|nr:hypothetical protein VE02_00894 [Pseudogymnoascus sp. 03VT05]